MPLATWRLVATGGLVVSALALASAPGRADVPPPAGFVESCTVEHESAGGKECVLCGDAYYAKPDACTRFQSEGYEKSCRTRGASTWKEVWCRQGGGKPAPAPSGSAISPVASAETAPTVSASEPAQSPPAVTEPTKAAPESGSKHGCGACRVGAAAGATGRASVFAALGLLGLTLARRQRSKRATQEP